MTFRAVIPRHQLCDVDSRRLRVVGHVSEIDRKYASNVDRGGNQGGRCYIRTVDDGHRAIDGCTVRTRGNVIGHEHRCVEPMIFGLADDFGIITNSRVTLIFDRRYIHSTGYIP